jgi:hypothetical protein
MAINPLKVASAGYLKRQTKAVLIIAVAGYLNFQGTPPIPPTPPSGGGGGESSRYTWEQQEEDNRLERIEEDDRLMIECLKVLTNIINNQ